MKKLFLIFALSTVAIMGWAQPTNPVAPTSSTVSINPTTKQVTTSGFWGAQTNDPNYVASVKTVVGSTTTNNGPLTSAVVIGDGGRGVVNSGVGATPINGNGTPTIFSQINALGLGNIITNNQAANTAFGGLFAVKGGAPTLTVNATALVASSSLEGNDTAMILHFVLNSQPQAGNSNYFVINLSSAYSTNKVIPTYCMYGTNSGGGATATTTRWVLYSTSNTVTVTSDPSAPLAGFDVGMAIHVDRF